jgi:glycosyltransferase involved in cell wall biosynthesis
VPLVLSIWGSDVMQFGSRHSLRASLRRTFDEARAIIAVSEELAERAGSLGAAADRLRVIPGGVPFHPLLRRADARERVGVGSDAVCILWVGGFVPVKQPLHAVAAFENFTATGANAALLVMIGDGPLIRDVRQFIRRKGLNVRLVGYQPREEVWRWHCAADVLLNSSYTEGTPLTVLEALGAGTPVAAYPLSGISTAVESVAGGTLALERAPRALAGALAAELATERDRGQLAERARAQFDIAGTGRDIEAVYDAVT